MDQQRISEANLSTGRFYDWARWFYPLIEPFFARGRTRLLGRINRVRPSDLLEVGVGRGKHLAAYVGHRVTAVDVSAAMVTESQANCPTCNVCLMDGEQLSFVDESFDIVVLCHVLSVTADPNRLLAEVRRVLRPAGLVFILNHETSTGLLSYLDQILRPFARWLHLNSWFRLDDLSSTKEFHLVEQSSGGLGGMFLTSVLRK